MPDGSAKNKGTNGLRWSAPFRRFLKKGSTMKQRFAVGAFAVAALVLSTAVAGDALKSGIPVGGRPSPFHPLNVTGAKAGNKHCLV
jgi:hypothetical protein